MATWQLSQKIWLVLLLTALGGCGENFSTGVSLGGSGSGGDKPNQNGGPNNGNAGEDDHILNSTQILIEIPKVKSDRCDGLERTIKFQNKKDEKELMVENLSPAKETQIVVTLYNNTAQTIYERIPACLPITLRYRSAWEALDSVEIEQSSQLSCPNQQAIHVLQPFEQRTYHLNLEMVDRKGVFSVDYLPEIASVLSTDEKQWHHCDEALSVEFVVQKQQEKDQNALLNKTLK